MFIKERCFKSNHLNLLNHVCMDPISNENYHTDSSKLSMRVTSKKKKILNRIFFTII